MGLSKEMVKLVIDGLRDGEYDLGNISEEIVLTLLAKDIDVNNTIMITSGSKLDV